MAEVLYKELSYSVIGCIYEIRNQYGPGQKENVYQNLLLEKLELKSVQFEKEKKIRIYSQDSGRVVGFYKPDIVVENKIIIELKSSSFTTKQDEKQLYHYLRNSEYQLGYLINFSTPEIFIKRMIYTNNFKPFLKFCV